MTVTLLVCTTCKGSDPLAEPRQGMRLHDALAGGDVAVRGVECLSACSNGCAVALQAAGKWTYVYGQMTPDDAPDILDGAAKYAASSDGIVPWRDRPLIFRKRVVARIPSFEVSS